MPKVKAIKVQQASYALQYVHPTTADTPTLTGTNGLPNHARMIGATNLGRQIVRAHAVDNERLYLLLFLFGSKLLRQPRLGSVYPGPHRLVLQWISAVEVRVLPPQHL